MKTNINQPMWLKLFVSLIFLFSASGAFAHAKYESSDPGRRSVVTRSPECIKILFSEQLEPAYSTIVIKNKEGVSVTEEKATIDPENKKRLILNVPTLTPGKYTVFYKVLSVDGHVVESKYKFRVREAKQKSD